MGKGLRRQHPAARRAGDEALLQQIRLDDLLDGVARLRQPRRDGLDPDRPAGIIDGDQPQIAMIERIEACAVDFELRQRAVGDSGIDRARALDRGEIAHAAQQPSRHARRAARAPRNLARAFPRQRKPEQPRPAPHDLLQLVDAVEFEPDGNAEALPERRRQQAGARGGADQREAGKIDAHRARRRPLADDQVELVVLERRIEDFLDRRVEPVDLVDEQHVAVFEIGEQRGEVAGLGDHRAGGRAEIHAELARHDLRERRLAETGRSCEQHMVERLAPRPRRLDEHLEIGADLGLADELGERLRPERGLATGPRRASPPASILSLIARAP